jgi:hypothetical protein
VLEWVTPNIADAIGGEDCKYEAPDESGRPEVLGSSGSVRTLVGDVEVLKSRC